MQLQIRTEKATLKKKTVLGHWLNRNSDTIVKVPRLLKISIFPNWRLPDVGRTDNCNSNLSRRYHFGEGCLK